MLVYFSLRSRFLRDKVQQRHNFPGSPAFPGGSYNVVFATSRDIVVATPRIEKQGHRRSVPLGISIGDDLVLPLPVPPASAMFRHSTMSEMYFCHSGVQIRQVDTSY